MSLQLRRRVVPEDAAAAPHLHLSRADKHISRVSITRRRGSYTNVFFTAIGGAHQHKRPATLAGATLKI